MTKGEDKIPVAVFFLQYDTIKYPSSLSPVKEHLSRLEGFVFDLMVIDNKNTGGDAITEKNGVLLIPGDNSSWEFSGWNKAIRYAQGRGKNYAAAIFINDSFVNNFRQNLAWLSSSVLMYLTSEAAAGGVLNFRNRHRGLLGYFLLDLESYGIRGGIFKAWLRSNFFILPWKSVENEGFETWDQGEIFSKSWGQGIYLKDAPLSENLKSRLVNYLSPEGRYDQSDVWHSHFKLEEASFEFFASKATAIINEMSLGQQIHKRSVPLIDIRLLSGLLNCRVLPRGIRRRCIGKLAKDTGLQARWLYWTRVFRSSN